MDKELAITESWKEVKEYIEYCWGWRYYCNAIIWTSTPDFLEPRMKKVEKAVLSTEAMKKVLHYSLVNRYIVKQAFDEGWISKEEYNLLVEVYGQYNCSNKEEL